MEILDNIAVFLFLSSFLFVCCLFFMVNCNHSNGQYIFLPDFTPAFYNKSIEKNIDQKISTFVHLVTYR